MLRALVFDVDGTLAETERDGHRMAFNRAFAEAGLPIVWDEATYGELLRVTGGKERIRHFLDRCPDCPALDEAAIAALHRKKTEHYTAWVRSGAVRLRPGVARLIREAETEGLRLAVATTTTPDNVEALLGRAGLRGAFHVIGAGDIVPAKKPAPDVYLWVLERLDLAPDEVIAFEDSENGLRAAQAAGLRTVVTPSFYTRGEAFDGAWALLSDLGEPERPATDLRTGRPVVVDVNWLRARLEGG